VSGLPPTMTCSKSADAKSFLTTNKFPAAMLGRGPTKYPPMGNVCATGEDAPLRDATLDSTEPLGMEGKSARVRVLDVYDGDTCTLAFLEPYAQRVVVRERVRLAGIDTPELRPPKSTKDRDAVVALAHAARARLVMLVQDGGPIMTATFGKRDKYGRPLVSLRLADGRDVARVLLAEGHAKPYDGGAKG
jgi:micrococcal nuclease